MPRAFITGITGQDGSYLGERLLAEGWDVHALVREGLSISEQPVDERVTSHVGDLSKTDELSGILGDAQPDCVFNLGGISSVARSWNEPVLTAEVTGVAAVAMLEAAWQLQENSGRAVRFVQASSSEIFGDALQSPQTELTAIKPVTPYGAAKALAHHAAAVYRARGLFASTAILYNHESPRRPESFVTRKITLAAARIALGKAESLSLGNMDVKRDWGWAPDYVDAVLRMAIADSADDFVIATGTSHTVREFVAAAFAAVGIDDWERFVVIDPRFVRPTDAHEMRGDPSRALELLGWSPTVEFDELVSRMARHDLEVNAEPGARATPKTR